MEAAKLALFFAVCVSLTELVFQPAEAVRVICPIRRGRDRFCDGQSIPCPLRCQRKCRVNCNACSTNCNNLNQCNRPGAVCQDPRFVSGDGKVFYFHGKKDKDFCIVSDEQLHINAHFIGKSKDFGMQRDFTWIQSLGILFGDVKVHKLVVAAKKVAKWDDNVDQLVLKLDDHDIVLPSGESASWEEPLSGVSIRRIEATNNVEIEVQDSFTLEVRVTDVSKEESRTHRYDIGDDDCFAHLDVSFAFHNLSPLVHGVLGQTYAPGYVSPVNSTNVMPVMGGNDLYISSGLMSVDCAVSRFGRPSVPPGEAKQAFAGLAMRCGTDTNGFACRRR